MIEAAPTMKVPEMPDFDPLRLILERAAELGAERAGSDGQGELDFARSSVLEAAKTLRDAYGPRALEKARRLEKLSSVPLFARLVSQELEKRSA
jgi:hypothetical protein